MTLSSINCNESLIEQISKFRKIAGYKINIQKTITFLYINDEHMNLKLENSMLVILG